MISSSLYTAPCVDSALGMMPFTTACFLARALLFTWVFLAVGPAWGQATDNDYYASRGTELLSAVERYHLGPGEEGMRTKHYDSAFGDFKFILNYFPNHPQALLLMAQLCETWKSPLCDAAPFFDRAIARNPTVATTYVAYGIYQLRARKTATAIANFKQALELDPNSTNAHYNIALAYLDSQQYELANEHAQKAYALGAPVPGLRDRLKRAGYWKPAVPGAVEPIAPDGKDAPTAAPEHGGSPTP